MTDAADTAEPLPVPRRLAEATGRVGGGGFAAESARRKAPEPLPSRISLRRLRFGRVRAEAAGAEEGKVPLICP